MELSNTERSFTKAIRLISKAESEWFLFRGEEQMIGFNDEEKFKRLSVIMGLLNTANNEWAVVRESKDETIIGLNLYKESEQTLRKMLKTIDEAIHDIEFVSSR